MNNKIKEVINYRNLFELHNYKTIALLKESAFIFIIEKQVN